MKTIFDAKQWILTTLLNGGVKSTINGNIYKDRKPTNSNLEDIVINSVVMDNGYLQDAVLNVNCYVPYIQVKADGITQYHPNHARLKAITETVYPLLDRIWGEGFNMAIVNHKVFDEDTEKSNYINFRINLKAFN